MTGLRWGILATGGIAHMFTKDLRTAGLDIAAVGSRRADAARAFADEFEIPHAHDSYEALVDDPDVDIVYVATPHPAHADNAILALEHGKHVLVEKPFTLNAAEAARVRDVAAANGLLAMEAMWTRYLPHMVRIRELLAEGALGDVRAVTADHTQSISTDPAHRLNALELGGGALLDLGIYPVSFAWDVLGAPTDGHRGGPPQRDRRRRRGRHDLHPRLRRAVHHDLGGPLGGARTPRTSSARTPASTSTGSGTTPRRSG